MSNEIQGSPIEQALAKIDELGDRVLDMKWVDVKKNEDGTINDVTIDGAKSLTKTENDAYLAASKKDGAQGGSGFYGKGMDGTIIKKDNALGLYKNQQMLKVCTDIGQAVAAKLGKDEKNNKNITSGLGTAV